MKNRICLITGADREIGKSTAIGLAKMGATVILLCRASEPEVEKITGKYFSKKKEIPSSQLSYDIEQQKKL